MKKILSQKTLDYAPKWVREGAWKLNGVNYLVHQRTEVQQCGEKGETFSEIFVELIY